MNQTAVALQPKGMLAEYQLDSILGRGAYGITYKAFDTHLKSWVAIKEYFPFSICSRGEGFKVKVNKTSDLGFYQWGLDRFIGEAQVLARFKHPNIVRILRYFTSLDTAYIVMEFEEGVSLRHYILSRKAAPKEAHLQKIFLPLIQGLGEVHQQNCLHRDIKPGNIFLRKDGSPVLLDFGAACLRQDKDPAGFLTPGYAPYEQHIGNTNLGPWTDVYALGATLYFCITRKTPPVSTERVKALESKQADPLVSAEQIGKGQYSVPLLKALDHILSIYPENRPRNMGEVLDLPGLAPKVLRVHESNIVPLRKYRKQSYKLIVGGGSGTDKNSAVATLSDTEVIETDVGTSEKGTSKLDHSESLSMDYGILEINPMERLHIYGLPEEAKFQSILAPLKKEAMGLVLLLDRHSKRPFGDLAHFVNLYREFFEQERVVIGLTGDPMSRGPDIEAYHLSLWEQYPDWPSHPPIMQVDPQNREEMSLLVEALLLLIDLAIET